MWKFIIILVLAYVVGVFGWSQVIGSLQNLSTRKGLAFTLILWLAILGVGAYFAIAKFDGLLPLAIGYGVSLVQTLFSGKIQ